MPSEHTTNYSLSQWAKDDQVRMEDFNADNAKIDAAIKAVADSKADASALAALAAQVAAMEPLATDHTVSGSYEGDGSTTLRTIPLPWEPQLVVLMGRVVGDPAIGFLTHDACLYSSGLKYYFADLYSPKIQGSAIVLDQFFNAGPSYYIAFR